MELTLTVATANLWAVKEGDLEEFRYQHKNCRSKYSKNLKKTLNVCILIESFPSKYFSYLDFFPIIQRILLQYLYTGEERMSQVD